MAGFGGWLRRLFGDSEKECPTASVLPGRVRSEGHKSFAEANNEFALAMYGQLRARLGNVFFSPFSIRTALAMAQAGARGKTAHQMVEVLRISMSDERLPVTFRTMLQQLNADGGTQYELAVANSLWGQDGVQLQAEYLDLISRPLWRRNEARRFPPQCGRGTRDLQPVGGRQNEPEDS
jgi:serpin (serine protease inhibitor)